MASDGNSRRLEQTSPLGANVGVSSERGSLVQTWTFAANLGLCSEPRLWSERGASRRTAIFARTPVIRGNRGVGSKRGTLQQTRTFQKEPHWERREIGRRGAGRSTWGPSSWDRSGRQELQAPGGLGWEAPGACCCWTWPG